MNYWGTYTRFLVENQIYITSKYSFSLFFSSTNGFQKNYDFSFANILPHGVCNAVYHPQHSLLLLGSLTGQGQRTSAGLLMWKENQVKKSGFVLIFFVSIVVVLIFVFFYCRWALSSFPLWFDCLEDSLRISSLQSHWRWRHTVDQSNFYFLWVSLGEFWFGVSIFFFFNLS